MNITRLVCCLAVMLLTLSHCRKKEEPSALSAGARVQPVEITKVTRRDMEASVRLTGSLEANESADVRAEISGIIRSIAFMEGAPVTRGQALAQIDDSELTAQRAEVEARYRLAVSVRERNAALIKKDAIALADVESAEAEVTRLKASLDLIDVRLGKMMIKAPFDGVAGVRHVSPGDFVSPETVLTQVDDLSRLKVSFAVPERYYDKLKPGGTFTVKTAAVKDEGGNPRPVQGEIYFAGESIDRTTRSAPVKGRIEMPPRGLKPGMFAMVELVLEQRKQVLAVPEGAILATARGVSVVAVRESGGKSTAEFVPVKTGLRQLGYVEITPAAPGDLTEGSDVVASGVGALVLFPGAPLKPVPQKEGIRKHGSRI